MQKTRDLPLYKTTNQPKESNQMKITFAAARVAVIAAVFLGLFVGSASFAGANDPIVGVGIGLGKRPNPNAFHATTDKAGRFVFDNLSRGTYTLEVAAPERRASINTTNTLEVAAPEMRAYINTTRSNIKHLGISTMNGVQVANVSVEMGTGTASAEIEITATKGRITGTVTRAAAPKEGGATPAQETPKKAAQGAADSTNSPVFQIHK